MFAKLFTAALLATAFVTGKCAAAQKAHTVKTIRPFTAELVNYETTLPYATVIERLDLAVNKSGSAKFLVDFHNSKTKEEQVSLIAGIVQDRTFLFFLENNHRAWLDVYDPSVKHPGATVYTLGNPNLAAQFLPLEYSAGVNIPPRFMVLETPRGSRILYHQLSAIFAPFNKHNAELQGHIKDLDVNFEAMFDKITDL